MHPTLQRNRFFIKEQVGFFRAANHYDIFDAETGQEVLHCREPRLGFFTKWLRFTDYKRMTPFDVHVTTPEGEPVLRIQSKTTWFLSKVAVMDENHDRVGGFKQKFWSIGGAFRVLDENDQELCELQGKWTSWEFSFKHNDIELARVTKKWAGLAKELFTTADNYILTINEEIPPDNPLRVLIMAAVLCIDMVLKE